MEAEVTTTEPGSSSGSSDSIERKDDNGVANDVIKSIASKFIDSKDSGASAAAATSSPADNPTSDDGVNGNHNRATAVAALEEYFRSKGVSTEDVQTTIRVLNAVSDLSHKNSSHKRKHVGSVTSSRKQHKKAKSNNNHHENGEEKKDDPSDAPKGTANEEPTATAKDSSNSNSDASRGELLNDYRTSKAFRPFRKALMRCYHKILQPTMFDGHASLKSYRDHKETKTQVQKRRMAESSQQRKHIANTLLRKGRIEKLNAKLSEGADEEKAKLARLRLTMVPDGHVDTQQVVSSSVPLLTNGTSEQGSKPSANASSPVEVTTVNDETETEAPDGEPAVYLPKLRSCYVCKARFRKIHRFYDQLCPECADLNWAKRHQTRDLSGRVAIVTGARVKIGYQTCLKLLRAGCYVIATTRFPNAAAQAYQSESDFDTWKDRLEIYGLDLRDVTGLELFCKYLQHKLGGGCSDHPEGGTSGPVGLDILINNACQTIRRPAAYYLPACQKEEALWKQASAQHKGLLKGCLEYERLRRRLHLGSSQQQPPSLAPSSGVQAPRLEAPPPNNKPESASASAEATEPTNTPEASKTTALATTSSADAAAAPTTTPFETTGMSHSAASSQLVMCPEDVGVDDSVLPSGLTDINGQQLDLRKTNSWLLKLDQVSTPELMECMFVNAIAPFVLNSRLQPLLTKRKTGDTSNRYVVNVSAMEGKFYRYKMANHPHTNMAKSALNMMTRTAAEDLAKNHGVYMNSIDTGWINDENPLEKAAQTAKVNDFQTPIDEIDAAARLVDPIFSDSKVYGKFLKDYRETEW